MGEAKGISQRPPCIHDDISDYLILAARGIRFVSLRKLVCFSSTTHYAKLMDKAEYQQKEKRQRQNSKPSHSPDEAELAKLMGFLDHELALTTVMTSTG